MRVDLYTLIHKAQRFHLFRLSNDLGKTDFADPVAAVRACDGLRRIIAHLRDHARNEETYIHLLYRKLEVSDGDAIEADHQTIEAGLERLEKLMDERKWEEIYPVYARFLGGYLIHLDEEEQAQRDMLWQNYGDHDLAAVLNRFKAERAPASAKADLEFMLPALSVVELTQMFQAMKVSAAAPVFQGACALAAQTLSPATWERVAANVCH